MGTKRTLWENILVAIIETLFIDDLLFLTKFIIYCICDRIQHNN